MKKDKKNEKVDYISSSLWYREVITNPYEVITEVFQYAEISFYRKFINGISVFANKNKVYCKRNPSSLLEDFRMLEAAINATYLIRKKKSTNALDKAISDSTFSNKTNIIGVGRDRPSDWNSFPRQLSKKEYCNPHIAIRKFFKFKELEKWKVDLQDLLTHCLSKYGGCETNALDMYLHLTKLIEAAHLIKIRSISNKP